MDEIIKQLLTYGPLGLWLGYQLWVNNQQQTKLDKSYAERYTELRQCVEAMHDLANAVEAQTAAFKAGQGNRP